MDKIKKIIFTLLGLLMILNILGVDLDVFAAESVGYSKTEFTLYYRDNYYPNVSGQCNEYIAYSDFPDFTGWSALDTTLGNYNSITGKQSLVGRIGFRIYGNSSNKYVAGNTYTVRFTIDFENEYFRDIFLQYYTPFYFRGNTTANMDGNSENYFDSYSTRKAAGSEPNRALVYITFTPNQDLLFLRFDMINASLIPINDPNKLTSNCHLVGGRVNYEYLQITYTAGVQGSIDNQTNVIKDQTDKLNNSLKDMMEIFQKENQDTNDVLTDSTPPEGTDQFVDDMVGYLPPGPVDGILNLPLQFLNKYLDGLTGSCSPINLPLPFVDETLTLQCPNRILSQIDGFDMLYMLIGLVGASYMIFKYLMSLYVWVDRTLTLRENNEPGYFDEP